MDYGFVHSGFRKNKLFYMQNDSKFIFIWLLYCWKNDINFRVSVCRIAYQWTLIKTKLRIWQTYVTPDRRREESDGWREKGVVMRQCDPWLSEWGCFIFHRIDFYFFWSGSRKWIIPITQELVWQLWQKHLNYDCSRSIGLVWERGVWILHFAQSHRHEGTAHVVIGDCLSICKTLYLCSTRSDCRTTALYRRERSFRNIFFQPSNRDAFYRPCHE